MNYWHFLLKKDLMHATKSYKLFLLEDWWNKKDPFAVLHACKILQQQGIPFHLQLIVNGILKRDIEKNIANHQLIQANIVGNRIR